MATAAGSVSADRRDAWEADGFVLLRGFAAPDVCATMLARAIEIGPGARDVTADSLIADFARDPTVFDLAGDLVSDHPGTETDVVHSGLVLETPGAYGRLWHQDSYVVPVEPACQISVVLAVTEATLENGCLWVLPGSHTQPLQEHLPDRRADSPRGYVEIVDHDTDAAVPVPMEPGDLLLLDGHLMHRSTDNHSNGARAAVVSHYRPADPTG